MCPTPTKRLQAVQASASITRAWARPCCEAKAFPLKIVTGYVSPGDIYHAWIMVYIDGTWKSAQFSVSPNTWSRVDLTFAASGGGETWAMAKAIPTDLCTRSSKNLLWCPHRRQNVGQYGRYLKEREMRWQINFRKQRH